MDTFPQTGESLGQYRLETKLSETLFGPFFLATVRDGEEPCLIHLIHPDITESDEQFVERYRKVVEKLKLIQDPHVAVPDRVEEVNGILVVAYRSEVEISLSQYFVSHREAGSGLPEAEVKNFLEEIGKGLDAARHLELGHYFLLPEFVFLTKAGVCQVAGIGLFESINYKAFEHFVSTAVQPIVDNQNLQFRYLEILSPEIRNEHSFDSRSDFYGIGMLTYLILIGEKPVRNWTLPSQARPGIKEGWDYLISHCLEPDPRDRFPTFKTFLRHLAQLHELTKDRVREDGRKIRRLDWIPLPKILQYRYQPKTLTYIRLFMLGLVGLLSVGTASMFLFIIFEDVSIEQEQTRVRRLLSQEGSELILNTNPENCEVVISGSWTGSFPVGNGKLFLGLGTGKYKIEVSAPLYESVAIDINVNRKREEPLNRNVILEHPWADLEIKADPETAVEVISENQGSLFLDTIGKEGRLTINDRLLEGEYRFRFSRKGYESFTTEPVQLTAGELTELQPKMNALPGQIHVRSDPEGATVVLDGEDVGQTPYEIMDLPANEEVRVAVEMKGKRSIEKSFQVSPAEIIEFDAGELEDRKGSLNYEVLIENADEDDWEQVELTVDGEPVSPVQSGEIALTEGRHEIKATHPDYVPVRKAVEVGDRAYESIQLKLSPKSPRVVVKIDTDNPARIFVNDEFRGGDDRVIELETGKPYKLEIQIRDYETVSRSFTLDPNEEYVWEVPLEPLPGPKEDKDWNPPYFELPMAWVSKSRFTMGSPVSEGRRSPNEDKQTVVRISRGLWVARYETTQRLYRLLMGSNPSRFNGESRPVENVSWEDAVTFTQRLSAFEKRGNRLPEGYHYRLPTEAEWEYFARAGTKTPFSFGETATPEEGNFQGTYPSELDSPGSTEHYGTVPVGEYDPNPWGLYDVHGNVAEWTMDVFWDRLPGGTEIDYVNLDEGRGRVVRGGSWQDSAHRARSAARQGLSESAERDNLGFRIVLAPEIEEEE